MAIAFDAVTTNNGTSYSHTTSGSDRALVLYVLSGGADNITATYNSIALTKKVTYADGGGNRITLLTLLTPSNGSNTVSLSGASINTSIVVSYTGVTAFSGQTSGNNTSTSLTLGVTVGVTNSWVSTGGTSRVGPHDPTPSTGVTNDRSGANTLLGVGDSGPEAIGTVNHTWNNDANNENSLLGIALEPAGAAGVSAAAILLGAAF